MRVPSARTRPGPWASAFILILCMAGAPLAHSQSAPALSPETRTKIDRAAEDVLRTTGVPSASVAIVKDGQIAYLQAYGDAHVDPRTPARPAMRYSIGSISKQFTATAILLLADQGKLTLDDPVGKYLPTLTRANEVTIREILSHTSGYQDYWPQDYVPPFMTHPISAEEILKIWAHKPLDFDPGTKWEYSNTNYVIAGLIVEKVSGTPLLQFLSAHIFKPLGMESVANIDQDKLGDTDATGYMRYALGPLRVAPKEGKGWLFAAGELAMPAEDLAKWDIGMLEQRLLKPATYKEMQTALRRKDGVGVRYGLGVFVDTNSGRRILEHGGEVSGFSSENIVFPDDRAAIVVLTNQDSTGAPSEIGNQIAKALFAVDNAESASNQKQAQQILEDLQHGKIDRSLFTENGSSYFTDDAVKDFSASLTALGTIEGLTLQRTGHRGGMDYRQYQAKFAQKMVELSIYAMPDGKIEQYEVIVPN
ncbi:MAG: serine hydrolase domain-containing protein [Candidatus Acidiferrales bacterium]